jgi:PAS domain S-box-containing protein
MDEVLGWRLEELIGANLFDFIHPDDMARTIHGAKELSNGVGHQRFDNRYRDRDGSYRWISWSTGGADKNLDCFYVASPRLTRYSIGLRAPRETLIRFSLYQRM